MPRLTNLATRLRWRLSQRFNDRLASHGYVLLKYNSSARQRAMLLIEQVRRQVDLGLDNSEACQLINAVEATTKIQGDLAEVGVFQGGSAKLLCETKGMRALHLFDTFQGLPEPQDGDESRFHSGQYRCSLDQVKSYLQSYPAVHLYPGYFPETSAPVADKQFSFVHLDVDLYESTIRSLEFFYPRVTPGGIIISHDYGNAAGVRKAFTEFFASKPEPVCEVALSQALVVKSAGCAGRE